MADISYEERYYESPKTGKYLQMFIVSLGGKVLSEMDGRSVNALKTKLVGNNPKAKEEVKRRLKSTALKMSEDEWGKIVDQVCEKISSFTQTL